MNSGAKTSRPALNRLMADARARKFDCLLVWRLDRFGRSLVDCLNKHQDPGGERHPVHLGHPRIGYGSPESGVAVSVARAGCRGGVRAGTDPRADPNRPSCYKRDFESGKVGKTVYSRSGRNMPPHGQGQYSTGRKCSNCAATGGRIGKSQPPWAWGWGRWFGRYRSVPKVRKRALGTDCFRMS